MAISPPSDILLDVANAADPAKVRAATARLATLAADPTAQNTEFGAALKSARANLGSSVADASASSASSATAINPTTLPTGSLQQRAAAHGKPSVYTKFEAVLLTSFVESMLPKNDELFGDKNSAGVYRSMMAEQLANQIANAGGIGIAKSIEAAHPAVAHANNRLTRGA